MATFGFNRTGRTAELRRPKLTRHQRLARAICFEPMESRMLMSATYSADPVAYFTSAMNQPMDRMVMDSSGNLYGTTLNGFAPGVSTSYGSVFEVSASTHQLSPVAFFNYTNGADPRGGLAIGTDGTLYGTTAEGGSSGHGTAFKIAPNSNTITTLVNFNGLSGSDPLGVIVGQDGNLYGVTNSNDGLLLSQSSVFK